MAGRAYGARTAWVAAAILLAGAAGAASAQNFNTMLRQAAQNVLRQRQMQSQAQSQAQSQSQAPSPQSQQSRTDTDAGFVPIDRGEPPAADYAVWRSCAETLKYAPSSRDDGFQAARRALTDAVAPVVALADAGTSLDQMETDREGWFKRLAPTDQELKNKTYRDQEAQRLMVTGHFNTAQIVMQNNQRQDDAAAHNYVREEARQRIASIETREQAMLDAMDAGPARLEAYGAAWSAYETVLRGAQARLEATPVALDALPALEREALVLGQCPSAGGTYSDAVTSWSLSDKAGVLAGPLSQRLARAQAASPTADAFSAAIAPYTGSRALTLNPTTAALIAPATAALRSMQARELALSQARQKQMAVAEAAEQKQRAAVAVQQRRAANLYQGAPTASQILLVSDRLNSDAYGYDTTATPGELVRNSALGEVMRTQRSVSNVVCRPAGAKAFTCDYDFAAHSTGGDPNTLAGFLGSLAVAIRSDASAHGSYTFVHDGTRWTSPQMGQKIADDKVRAHQEALEAAESAQRTQAMQDQQQRQLNSQIQLQQQLYYMNHQY